MRAILLLILLIIPPVYSCDKVKSSTVRQISCIKVPDGIGGLAISTECRIELNSGDFINTYNIPILIGDKFTLYKNCGLFKETRWVRN